MIKNIVFDWSGVLSNDFEPVYHTVRAMFHDLDLAPLTFSHFQDVVEIPFQNYLKKLSVDQPEILARFSDRDRNHKLFNKYFDEFGPPSAMPGVESALQQLSSMNLNMAVFSSHHQNFIEQENLAYFDGNFFSLIFGSAGDKILSMPKLLQLTKFVPQQTIYVGDTTHDIAAGRSVGMKTAAVLSGYHIKEKLLAARPDFVLNSVAELPCLLQNTPSLSKHR